MRLIDAYAISNYFIKYDTSTGRKIICISCTVNSLVFTQTLAKKQKAFSHVNTGNHIFMLQLCTLLILKWRKFNNMPEMTELIFVQPSLSVLLNNQDTVHRLIYGMLSKVVNKVMELLHFSYISLRFFIVFIL